MNIILTYLHTYILTYLHTYILTYLHTYILTYLHTYIPLVRSFFQSSIFSTFSFQDKIRVKRLRHVFCHRAPSGCSVLKSELAFSSYSLLKRFCFLLLNAFPIPHVVVSQGIVVLYRTGINTSFRKIVCRQRVQGPWLPT